VSSKKDLYEITKKICKISRDEVDKFDVFYSKTINFILNFFNKDEIPENSKLITATFIFNVFKLVSKSEKYPELSESEYEEMEAIVNRVHSFKTMLKNDKTVTTQEVDVEKTENLLESAEIEAVISSFVSEVGFNDVSDDQKLDTEDTFSHSEEVWVDEAKTKKKKGK